MNIPEAVSRHAIKLQWFTALSGFAAALLWVGIALALGPAPSNGDLWLSLFAGPLGALLSIHISWVAIWGVLGTGSVTAGAIRGLAIVYAAFAVVLVITFFAGGDIDSVDFALILVAFAYATIGQLFLSMTIVWSLKYFRLRLVYVDDVNLATGNSVTHVVPGRIHLKDLFALMTLFAIGFVLWLPSVGGFGAANDTFLGPGFIFLIMLFAFCSNGVIGIAVVLAPMLFAISARLKTRTQVAIHVALFLIAFSATIIVLSMADSTEERLFYCSCFGTFIIYQTLLVRFAWQPSSKFRFRLIRGTI